ncbi:MAG: hypothetical protein ABI855_13540, partial [Bacteroidota bacterium]
MKKQNYLAGALLAIMMSATSIVNAQWQQVGTTTLYFNTGNVGIGTSSPTSNLVVSSSQTVSLGAGAIFQTGLSSGKNIVFDTDEMQARNNGASSNLLLNRLGGKVGIGTSSPSQMLTVAAGMNVDGNNVNSGTLTNSLTFGNTGYEGIASKRTSGG